MFRRQPASTVPIALIIFGIVLSFAACAASTDTWYAQDVAAPQFVGRGYDRGVEITPAVPVENETCRSVLKRRVNDFGEVVEIRTRVCAEGAGYGREPWTEAYRGDVSPSDPNLPSLDQPDDIGEPN